MYALGRHLLVEYYDCDPQVLNDCEALRSALEEAARVVGASIVQSAFHRFSPHGISGVLVISESHLAVHTWPEYGYAAVDLFTCGTRADPWRAFELLKQRLRSGRAQGREVKRGILQEVVLGGTAACPPWQREQRLEYG